MTFTIWSNGGKFEWIIYTGDCVLDRSGLLFKSYKAALSSLKRYLKEND